MKIELHIVLTFFGGLIVGAIIGVRWANWAACRMFGDVVENSKIPYEVKPPNIKAHGFVPETGFDGNQNKQ
jgi:prolipoprotein diacylglyceryltransferase